MVRNARIMASLQQLMDKMKTGLLLSVNILNQDELNIMIEDTSAIMDKFFIIVRTASEESGGYIVLKTPDPTIIYIILPEDASAASRLAYTVNSQVQLYFDEEFPESYLKCLVGSIKFFPELNLKADKLLSMLAYGILSSRDSSYYYSYNDNPINIEIVRECNIKLNLLRISLFNKKAKFVYQPIIDRQSGNIEYYECLLRVTDKHNNLIPVGAVIEDAEKKGLINVIDFTVVEMAIKELERDKEIKLSVNISNIGVLNHRLLKKIEILLTKYNVANRLIIEITETALNRDFNTTKKFIDTLHKYGCKFALDDFGSGFTSFKQLLNLPIDIIKIDGSYIRDILSNNHSKFFVEALIGLAKDLGIKTVAEFVENGEIARFLVDIKIDSMQGDFFLPASENRVHY